ncbi:MAG: preprotein translocase subunit SecG [Chlamydiae bacterium RIFCSPHIGHO2_12_FULL_49_9]|nr:MAG: preprotein translocase subunit SecG [Chlamydiae bacterium RIFCSPHIGHO2_12_FULL_49_9]
MTFLFYIALFLFLFASIILCFVILIQEAKSLGLGASFGGDNSDSLFGTSTAEVLKKFTAYLTGAFLVSCLILSFWSGSLGRKQEASVQVEESR